MRSRFFYGWVIVAIAFVTGVGWEIVEHTDMVLNRFRGQTIYQGYVGDSVLNAVSDFVFMWSAFLLGAVLPVRLVLALILGGMIGWRSIFYITGSLGILLSFAIFFGVKDIPRGSSEEELRGVEVAKYKFNWKAVGEIFKKRSLILVFLQGFIGVFPWNEITYYFFGYLATDRGYDSNTQLIIMAPAVLFMALGYPLGGILGDKLFKRTPRGRLIIGATGILLGMVFLFATMNVPVDQVVLFMILLFLTALFMPFPSPNIISTIYDVTLPEVRSTANAVQNFIESIGSAAAPLIAGIIADATSVGNAILVISLSSWALCFLFILGAILLIPRDIKTMHQQLADRAASEKAHKVI